MTVLRIVSYNIHKGKSVSGRDSLAALRVNLHTLNPDIMFLQEVQGRNEKNSNLHAQHESLAAALQMQVAYEPNAVRVQTHHGNALLAKYPIIEFENQDISDHGLEQRGLLHGILDIKGARVHCVVVHLGLFAASRIRQIDLLCERIERLVPKQEPLLVAGDFNDWKDELAPLFVDALGVSEVFAQSSRQLKSAMKMPELSSEVAKLKPSPRTFPAAFPLLPLDRIYQRGFAVKSAKVLKGRPWTQLSDHAPIVAELELP